MKYTNTAQKSRKLWNDIRKIHSDIEAEKVLEESADFIIESTSLNLSKKVHTFSTEWEELKPLDTRLTVQQTKVWKIEINKIPEKWVPYIRWAITCMPTTYTEGQKEEVELFKHGLIRVNNKYPYQEQPQGRLRLYDVVLWVRVVMISNEWKTKPQAKLLIKLLNPEVSG